MDANPGRFNLTLLIHGYVALSCSNSDYISWISSSYRNASNVLYIPADIINLIIIYYTFYGLDSHTFLVSIETNSSQYEIMKLFNISKQKVYKQRIIFADPNFNNFKQKKLDKKDMIQQWNRKNPGQCIINNISLPFYLQKNKYLFEKYHDYQQNISSTNWSLIINIGGYNNYKQSNECHLTAFNRAGLVDDPTRYSHAYNFELPRFPELTSNPSIVYNTNNQILYAMNGLTAGHDWNDIRGRRIYSLNLSDQRTKYIDSIRDENMNNMNNMNINNETNEENMNNINIWKWNIQSTNLKRMRFNTSATIVDDNFIAILGGYREGKTLNYGELYALNCDKSIWLKCMKHNRQNSCSIYHSKYHKIIIGGEDIKNGIECYDINKDIWTMLKMDLNSPYNRLQNLWISPNNPNIVFLVGIDLEYNVYLESMDIRQTQKNHSILIHSKSLFYASIAKARKKHFGLLYSSFYPNNSSNEYYGLTAIHL